MKIGDLVKLRGMPGPMSSGVPGVIVKLFRKKVWRTQELGPNVNWDLVDPEPHAEVMINENILGIPIAELELV